MAIKYKFIIEIDFDTNMNAKEVEKYVKDSLMMWGGSFHPDSEFFGDNKRIRVTRVKEFNHKLPLKLSELPYHLTDKLK